MELDMYNGTDGADELAREVLQRKIHLVTMASLEEDTALKVMESLFNIHEVAEFIDAINKKRETGTFSPRLWLTLYPQVKKHDRVGDRILQVVKDIVDANEQHMKAERILVDIHEKAGYDTGDFIGVLRHTLAETPAENKTRSWFYRVV